MSFEVKRSGRKISVASSQKGGWLSSGRAGGQGGGRQTERGPPSKGSRGETSMQC